MPFGVEPIQLLIVAALAATIGYIWHLDGRGRWRATLTDRFLYGVPWGTLITIVAVVAFYLFAQSGLHHWNDPVTVAFRSWSYSYLPGMLAAGFAHGSPGHLVGNMIGTVVLAPLAEYAWSHYPRPTTNDRRSADEYQYPPPSGPGGKSGDEPATDAARGTGGEPDGGLLTRPWFRAFVAFPAVVFAVSIVTSVLALGWSLGFSGTVFAFGGFVVVLLPLTSVVAMLGISAVGVSYRALTEPVLRVTADPGAPSPPSWAGVNVQAHLLGFLLGVLLGLAVLRARRTRPAVGRIFLAVLTFGIARQLWAIPLSDDDVFLQYRGVGLLLVLAVTVLVTATAAADDTPLVAGRLPKRTALVAGLVLVVTVIAVPSAFGNLPGMADDPVPEGAVSVEDYRVTYAEDASHGRVGTTDSGVIVVSERRDVWLSAVSKQQLAHDGTATIPVGGVGWRTPVEAQRTGWEVVGNDSVYAVDLTLDGETTRSFTSPPSRAAALLANHSVTLRPAAGAFRVAVSRNGTTVGTASIPSGNGTATAGPIRFETVPDGRAISLLATVDGTRVEIASRETY